MGAMNSTESVDKYARDGQHGRYTAARKRQQNKGRRKKALIIACSIVGAIVIAVTVLLGVISCNMNAGMGNIGLTPTSLDKPFYMVLMGVDSSEERKANGGTDEDYRSDSIILARIAADEKKVTLMSFHRDIEIEMGQYGTQKLNAAHSLGGPKLVIETISKLAGVKVNHYAEINFDGFAAAVDDLGGVEVDVPMDILDEYAGVVYAGKQTLNGADALTMCRARHAFDAYGDGDKYRAANQRIILSAIAQKVLSADILTIAQTATDLSKYIKTDLALNDIIGLAQLMKGLNPDTDVYSAMTPTEGVYKNGGWYETLDEEQFEVMMKRMDQGLPPDPDTYIDPATGTIMSSAGGVMSSGSSGDVAVTIRNGTTRDGLAAEASSKLVDLGYRTNVGNANSQDYTSTVIVYDDDSMRGDAEKIRDELGCGQVMKNNGDYLFNTDILVVVGTDFSS